MVEDNYYIGKIQVIPGDTKQIAINPGLGTPEGLLTTVVAFLRHYVGDYKLSPSLIDKDVYIGGASWKDIREKDESELNKLITGKPKFNDKKPSSTSPLVKAEPSPEEKLLIGELNSIIDKLKSNDKKNALKLLIELRDKFSGELTAYEHEGELDEEDEHDDKGKREVASAKKQKSFRTHKSSTTEEDEEESTDEEEAKPAKVKPSTTIKTHDHSGESSLEGESDESTDGSVDIWKKQICEWNRKF